ncbi:RNA 2'-phosphotransferase [Methanosarcinales archaeon]|nr:MAG: RNA 2'-phosphotransferase [Methanosarcinales archaeon]
MIRECRQHGYFRGERCVCGNEGKLVLDDDRIKRIGRFVSGALRHFPDDVGLAMSLKGWVNLDLLVEIMQERYRWATKKHLIALVESDEKGRYEIQNERIRARYGHSTNVTLDFPDNTLPTLYYGTSEEEIDIILENGIKPLKQRYVHLSTDVEKAVAAASIHTEKPIIIEIDAVNSQKNNILMMQATDDIVLSETVPAQYLRRLQ